MDLSKISKLTKIQYISGSIESKKDNNYFYILSSLIEKHNIEHSINKNGIFLNLSAIDDTILNDIYEKFINNEKKHDTEIDTIQPMEIIFEKNFIKKPKIIKKDKLHLEKFDKCLLELSKIHI